jgi:hypothetical protein
MSSDDRASVIRPGVRMTTESPAAGKVKYF